MKLKHSVTLEEIANLLDAEYSGNPDLKITGLNEIHVAGVGDVIFADNEKYFQRAFNSSASAILISKAVPNTGNKGIIVSDHPFDDFNKLIAHFNNVKRLNCMIYPDTPVGEHSIIRPNVFIGANVQIGNNCMIHPGVVIYGPCKIGNGVVIHSNTVIGADAFYYKKTEGTYKKLLSCGGVVIGDDVDIGAACTVDRGATENTTIGKGTKIDNQVMIGHDTKIGENCLFAAQVGIAGAVEIEDDVVLWGQVGVASGLTIGKGAVVLAQAGIPKSIKGGITYFGTPADEAKKHMRELMALRSLPDIIRQL